MVTVHGVTSGRVVGYMVKSACVGVVFLLSTSSTVAERVRTAKFRPSLDIMFRSFIFLAVCMLGHDFTFMKILELYLFKLFFVTVTISRVGWIRPFMGRADNFYG